MLTVFGSLASPRWHLFVCTGFPGGLEGKASACNAGDPGSIPELGRSPGEGNGSQLQYSCLGNPIDGGAWEAAVHGVAKSRTRLSDFTFTFILFKSLKYFLLPNWFININGPLRTVNHETFLFPSYTCIILVYSFSGKWWGGIDFCIFGFNNSWMYTTTIHILTSVCADVSGVSVRNCFIHRCILGK